MSAIPLAPLPEDIAANVEQLGAKQVNLYRCLAHAPELLRAWINFAWALRGHETTERRWRPRRAPPTTRSRSSRCGAPRRPSATVTAAFYSMVPRVLDALGVPIEEREPPPAE